MLSLGLGREAVHLKSWSEIVGKLPGPRLQCRGRSVTWEPVPAAHVLSPLSSWTSWALGSKGQKKAGEDAGAGRGVPASGRPVLVPGQPTRLKRLQRFCFGEEKRSASLLVCIVPFGKNGLSARRWVPQVRARTLVIRSRT